MRAYRSLGAFACVGKCRSYGAQSAFICVYPGFHIGLCPHSTLGFAGVPPLQGFLSDWAFAELCRGIVFVVFIPLGHLLAWVSAAPTELNSLLPMFTQGFISGFALIPPWAMQECRPCRALFILLFAFTQGFISGFALIPPWALQEYRPCRALFILLSAFTQGSISGFALIPPWALQECRPCRALCRIGLYVLGCVNELVRSGNEPQGGDTPA